MGDNALKLRVNRVVLYSGLGGGCLWIRRVSFERRSLRKRNPPWPGDYSTIASRPAESVRNL